jgi:hypothetical protein
MKGTKIDNNRNPTAKAHNSVYLNKHIHHGTCSQVSNLNMIHLSSCKVLNMKCRQALFESEMLLRLLSHV